jgi:hypothetical protein
MNNKRVQMIGISGREKDELKRKLYNAFPSVHDIVVGDAEHLSDYLVDHTDVRLSNSPIAEIDHKYFVFEKKVG